MMIFLLQFKDNKIINRPVLPSSLGRLKQKKCTFFIAQPQDDFFRIIPLRLGVKFEYF